ncbi:RagB/SusD family nutrient uptake outer membrane protein [Sphingobacterium tabacisoli]|uniref:RagB/SusD family nutrient uptake outer membrane protein n=1 Tax=Sphingobacterium tabacisoli TaxID=2044855 RepID=A0ABW5KZI4_9SPHI|nr:RagB/SusD family nutrient uptake outer membrane protein [Sphingobacterium tabacisoli]
MKNIFKSFLFVAMTVGLGLSSCTGLLDITPVNGMKPETISDYESILLGGYPRRDYFLRTELMTDNAMVNLNTTYKLGAAEEPWFVFSSSHMLGEPIDPYWGQLYQTIFYANTVLDKFAGITPDASEKKKYDQVKGEAYALRAYAYFYLINMYADVYAPENLDLPGVPMPLDAEDVNEFSKDNVRQPIEKVWAQIESDLKQAETLLQGKPGNDRFRFNITTVQLLNARVALFMGKYDKAIDYASEVMASVRLSDMNTMQTHIDKAAELKYAFSGNFGFIDTDYNNEILFFTAGRANQNFFYYYQAAAKPTEELLQLTKRNGDLVDYRQYIFDSFEDFSIQGAALVGKTVYNMFATQDRNWFFIGLKASEAYVIRAEAYARKLEYGKALADINKLLVTRYKKGSFVGLQESDYTDKNDILKRVLDERRLETAFDAGLRFFDLRRLGKPEIKHIYKNSQEFVLKKNDPRYVLQIPESEQNNSPNMPINPR